MINALYFIDFSGMALMFIALLNIIYLKQTKLREAELLFRGHEIMTANFFTAGLACLQYGGAFVSRWMAKRSHMLEACEKIPECTQLYFKIHFWLFTLSFLLMFVPAAYLEWVIKT